MKVSLKLLIVLFVIAMIATLAACGPAATPAPAPTAAPVANTPVAPAAESTAVPPTAASAASAALTADGRYPAQPVKICVETFDPADTQYKGVQDYLGSLSQRVFNVEYVYSEKIDSAEQELQFIENCAAAGGKGLIAYYNVSKAQAVAKAAELGIYYWGIAEEKDVYDAYKNNPYYLGSVTLGNGDYDGMYAVTKALLDQGKTKLVYANGGADFGITMFVNRKAGFQAAVDEAKKAGKDIQVTEVPGFPNEAWFAAQGAALAKDIDAVVGSFGADVWAQPITAANKADKVKVGSFGAITDFYKQVFDSGLVTAIAAEPTERFGIGIAQIINAVDGNAAALQENGAATNASEPLWIIKSPADFAKVAVFEAGDGRAQYSTQLPKLIKNLNPDASVATLKDLIKAYSLESIVAGK
jgi:hypothetical protein